MTFYSSPESTAFAAAAPVKQRETAHRDTNAPEARGRATLTVPVPPSANRWHRQYRGQRTPSLSPEAKAYLADLPNHLPPGLMPFDGDVVVDITWFRARKSGDVDKRGAILLDALQGFAWDDDKQVADYRIRRDDSQPGRARMVVVIRAVRA